MPSLFAAAAAIPWLASAAAFVLGACLGSFLNVVIVRLPAGGSVVAPRSHCACGTPVARRDLIPILSWVRLRGRARCCGRPISPRYPAVELLTALLFLASWRLLPPAAAACGWVFLGGMIAAAAIDLEHLLIPDTLTLGLGLAGLVLSLLVPELHGQSGGPYALDSLRSGTSGLLGLLVGSGLMLWIAVLAEAALEQEALGLGDIKFTGAIGAYCGWHGAVFAVFGGAVVGTVWLGAALIWRRWAGRAPLGRGDRVPFGPMLAVAAALYFLLLHAPVDAWFARLSDLY